ncbi:MAG: VWA domain-containing protein, partial [Candidatus Omnitrophica bacterium]|nr:VWA domain-containing protein [Candidatus Omnitrophota bacterium]
LAVRDLLKELKGDRVGLIAFAGDAYLMCPLTRDYNGFMLSLNDLDTNSVSRGGTNITRAIKKAMESYEEIPNQFKAVILVTDGDNLEDDPVSMAKEAKEKGIKIYTVGVGTAEGELIQVEDRQGQKTFIKDDKGNFVKSRLNERLLQEIALITEGGYLKASGAEFGLDLIYEKELSKMEKRQFESGREKKYHERFQWPLAAAVIFLVVESCLTTRKQ